MTVAVHWFRNGLRFHDNPALIEAINSAEKLITLYIFYEKTFSKYNYKRAIFCENKQYVAKYGSQTILIFRYNVDIVGIFRLLSISLSNINIMNNDIFSFEYRFLNINIVI